MCGIAGIIAPTGHAIDAAALRAMTQALAHRGPDGQGYHQELDIGLGHRRLSILDLDGGAQPLYANGHQVVGVVNGEIYNYRSLRSELISAGHEFRTQSDSEVVVHAYAHWGVACVERLEGQFAFAIWDRSARALVLGRDRYGEKPLFYTQLPDNTLVFASELRALLRHPKITRKLDPQTIARYLLHEYFPSPDTPIESVYKLPPSCVAVCPSGQPIAIHRYYDLPLIDINSSARESRMEPASRRLQKLVVSSVADRLIADVPVGVFLSGGLDSSLIAAAAKRARASVSTFTIAFDEPSYDESPHAQAVADCLGTDHHVQRLRADDVIDFAPRLAQLLDEPLGDASLIPTHFLSRFARQHITVALGGDGGDELFGGYPTMQAEAFVQPILKVLPRRFRHALRRVGQRVLDALPVSTANFSLDFKARQLLQGITSDGSRRHQEWIGSFRGDEITDVLADGFCAELDDDIIFAGVDDNDNDAGGSRWDRLLNFYVRGYLADDILHKTDRASMATSLEVRAPLLDSAIVSFACRCTPSLRSHGHQTKRVLKAAARGLVPDSIIDRSKHGFGLPLAAWLRGPLQPWLRSILQSDRLRNDGVFDPTTVTRLLDEHTRGLRNHRKQLWTLAAFQLWWDDIRS